MQRSAVRRRRGENVTTLGFSLAPRYIGWTILINVLILGAFLAVYYITNSNPANIIIASIYTAHVVFIWIVFLVSVSNPGYFSERVTGIRLLFLFLFTIVNYMILYSTVFIANPLAFTGIVNPTKSSILGNMLFLTIDTIASLGTGTIGVVSGIARMILAFNAIASIAFLVFAVTKILNAMIETGGGGGGGGVQKRLIRKRFITSGKQQQHF